MERVYLDTSIILYSFEKKLDLKDSLSEFIQGPFEAVVIENVMEELKKTKFFIALREILSKYSKFEKGIKGHADDVLIALAAGKIIATQDYGLKQKALKENIRVITVRQGRYLDYW